MSARARMAHEPRDAGALAMQALKLSRAALIGLVVLALVCLGVDLRDAAGAVASLP